MPGVDPATRPLPGRQPEPCQRGARAQRTSEPVTETVSAVAAGTGGGTGSDEETPLFGLPAVDRLALEMAANEDIERRALLGELELLHAAWKDAEEIASIADEMFTDDVFDEFKRQYFERLAQAEE